MKANNINNLVFFDCNDDCYTIENKYVKSFEIDDKPVYIEGNIAYKARIIIDANSEFKLTHNKEKEDGSFDKSESITSVKVLYQNPNISFIDVNGDKQFYSIINVYGNGCYSDSPCLYQHGYFEVDDNNQLTGNFVFEFYSDFFTNDICTLTNVYDLEKMLDDNFFKYNPYGLAEEDKEEYLFSFTAASKYLYNLGTKARNEYTFKNAIKECIDDKYKDSIHNPLINNVIKIVYDEWFNRKVELDIEEEQ